MSQILLSPLRARHVHAVPRDQGPNEADLMPEVTGPAEPLTLPPDSAGGAAPSNPFVLTERDYADIDASIARKQTSDAKHKQDAARRLVARHGGRLLSEISDAPPAPLLLSWLGKGRGRLDPEGHTMLFGPGGVGKGSLASYWAVELTRAEYRVLLLDHEMHPTEWARRVSSLGGPEARENILHFSLRGPLTDYAEDMRDIARDGGYTYAIVDSAAVAAPGKAEDSDAADSYSVAVNTLAIPVLTLAHLTKANDARYPFGSVFWHNLARLTWSLTPAQDGKVLLRNRKANNYPYQGRRAGLLHVDPYTPARDTG